ncbi:MAG: hypothetical protein ABIP94_18305 [Planctomycetota bacterium]
MIRELLDRIARVTKCLTGCAASAVLLTSPVGFAVSPSSDNYAIPSSTLNNGVGDMASANYKLSSSLGDSFFGGTSRSTNYGATPGLWPQIKGVLPGCVLDLDGNTVIDPLTDGLMLIRIMLGMTGNVVTTGVLGANAQRSTYAAIAPFVNLAALDIDGDGSTQAATDGLMILRAMFGLTGTAVTSGATGVNPVPSRPDWASIRTYLNASCGTAFGP